MKTNFKRSILFLTILFLVTSCLVPETRESYLINFGKFVENVEKNGMKYNETDWKWANKRFTRFSTEWYEKFENDLEMNEKIKVSILKTRYMVAKTNSRTGRATDDYLGKDLKKLGNDVRKYLENDFDEDLEEITKGAREIGDSAVKVMEEVLKGIRKGKK